MQDEDRVGVQIVLGDMGKQHPNQKGMLTWAESLPLVYMVGNLLEEDHLCHV